MNRRAFIILRALLVFIVVSLLFISFWIYRSFGAVSLAQAILLVSLDFNSSSTPAELTKHFLAWAILIPAVLTAVACISASLAESGRRLASLALLAALLPMLALFALQVNFNYFTRSATVSSTANLGNIYDQYKSPAITHLVGKPLNVVWIYAESLENSYTDPEINAELENATQFMTRLTVSPIINHFTIGGITSTKCGAPIALSTRMVLNYRNSIFKNATCFDDVLHSNGYSSYFVVGHDASLSGLRNFYKRHGAATIYDQKYMAAQHIPHASTFPTYPDETVFHTALDLLRSGTLKKPYALNILTYDNHAPSGFPSTACRQQYGTTMADVIRCNNHSLANFISNLEQNGQLRDTVLVIMGDHPYPAYFDQLSPDRHIFAKIYTPLADKHVLNNQPSEFDLFPSVLSAMGFNTGTQQYAYGFSFYDLPAYPQKDWKLWLATFTDATPTARYIALH